MCDYSLHAISQRPARLADRLITTQFRHTLTRGLSPIGEPDVAVCVRPGTELVFDAEVEPEVGPFRTIASALLGTELKIPHKVGRFRQVDLHNPSTHHDAIEFPDGRVVLVTDLRPGQRAKVLQLPAEMDRPAQGSVQEQGAATSTESVPGTG